MSTQFVKTFLFQAIQFSQTVLIQTIQLSISIVLSTQLNVKTILFQVIQLGATTPGQSGTMSDSNEGILRISQISDIIGTSASDCLLSYTGHSLGEFFLPLCRSAVGVFYSPSRLGNCL